RLQVQGPSVMRGYVGDDRIAAFTEDGWLETGDLGFLLEGELSITGRAKDTIIVRGVNHHAHEIEAAVDEIDGIAVSFTAACPVRSAGDDTDRLAIFFASTGDDGRDAELIAEIRARVAKRFGARPDHVIPVARADIPKTSLGKIQRAALQAGFSAGSL